MKVTDMTTIRPMGQQRKVDVALIEPGILESVYWGRVTMAMAVDLRAELAQALEKHPHSHWLVVLEPTAEMERAPKEYVQSVVRMFEGRGLIAAVTPRSSIHLVGAAYAFATGAGIRFFYTREEAIAYLRGQRAGRVYP